MDLLLNEDGDVVVVVVGLLPFSLLAFYYVRTMDKD
jgi:hypothetical protein